MVNLWLQCRGGMGGLQHLPERGGALDQGAWVMDALDLCAGTAAWLDKNVPTAKPWMGR